MIHEQPGDYGTVCGKEEYKMGKSEFDFKIEFLSE